MNASHIDNLLAPMRHETDVTRIHGRIEDIRRARFDVVAPQSALTYNHEHGTFALQSGEDGIVTPTGVIAPNSHITATHTHTAWRQVHERLQIPLAYGTRLRESAEPSLRHLGATNINEVAAVDQRRALYRFLDTEDGLVLRSVLSDRYQLLDNDTAFLAILAGLTAHDLTLNDCEIDGDVTPDRLRLRVAVPAINLAIPELLDGYRMPFSMNPDLPVHAAAQQGEVPPVVWAGIEISNSETGGGAFTICPRAVIMICRNGLTRPVEFRRAHVGSNLSDGVVQWSHETFQNALRLIASQVEDAVRQFMSVDYLRGIAAEMLSAARVPVASPSKAVETVQQRYGFTETESRNILDCFMRGGQTTLLGVGHAVTAAAQLSDDGDRQAEMEATFWQIIRDQRVAVAD